MTARNASAEAAKSRRCNACRPRSYIATASWYVGFRGGGVGEVGGARAAGFATRTGALIGLIGFAVRAGREDLPAVRADEPRAGDLTGRRRSVWARSFAIRAGLRAEVRGLVTRRDFAIDGNLANQKGPSATVTNDVMSGQYAIEHTDIRAYDRHLDC